MDLVYLSIILIGFLATLIRSTFGFGESLVAVPLFILFLPVHVAVPLSVVISVLVALIVVVQDHKNVHFKSAKWLVIYAAFGIPIGILLLFYGNEIWITVGLGTLIILYSAYSLFSKNTISLKGNERPWLFLCGFLSGVFGGAFGLNGPPLVVYGNLRRWNPKAFRATLQAYFLVASFLGMVGYGIKGLLSADVGTYFLVSLPGVIPAIFLGRFLNHRLNDKSFFRYIYYGLIIIGTFLIIRTLW